MRLEELYISALDSAEDFFARIDKCGGWPLGRKFVIVQHTVENERPCYFADEPIRNEWNTVRYSADDYYWWKLSDKRKGMHRKKVRQEFAHEITCQI